MMGLIRSLVAYVFTLGMLVSSSAFATQAQPLEELATPGSDIPTYGHSLFDALLADASGSNDKQLQVPFPFSELLAHIRTRLKADATPDSELFDAVLIPLGRSLQRHAAAPHYFQSPRLVVSVRGESDDPQALLLKDRLYLGYQPKSGVLEVISYNEAMGRFEFQIVKDYREHATPQLYYAPRMICMSCHQNQAPIFSRPLWRETNANPHIATELLKAGVQFQSVPVKRGIDIPASIDAATDRANRFALNQQLWRAGCALLASAQDCRATLLNAFVQLRLSGGRGYADDGPLRLDDIRKAWQAVWPQGLTIPNPDLPDVDPLTKDSGTSVREVRVAADVDPLVLRPPLGSQRFESERSLETIIADLGGFMSEADIRQLDRLLGTSSTDSAMKKYAADCLYQSKAGTEDIRRVDVDCITPDSNPQALKLKARLYFQRGQYQRGVIDYLRLEQESFADVQLDANESTDTAQVLRLQPRWQQRQLRRKNGSQISVIQLSGVNPNTDKETKGNLVVNERADYALLSNLLRTPSDNADLALALSDQPLRRSLLKEPLYIALGYRPGVGLGDAQENVPSPRLEVLPKSIESNAVGATGSTSGAAALGTLRRYCAACHDSAEHFPPNFLSGELATVEAKLRHCAERIDYRLAIWAEAPSDRVKTPMPPESALHLLRKIPEQWQTSSELQQLQQYIQSLRAEPNADLMHSKHYEQLQSCLPEGG